MSMKWEQMINNIQYSVYWIYYWGYDDAMVKDLCSAERMKELGATKKLTNIAIIINGLVNPGEKSKQTDNKDDKVSTNNHQSALF